MASKRHATAPRSKNQSQCSPSRTDCSPEGLRQAVLDHLYYSTGRVRETARVEDWYVAVSLAVRDRMVEAWVAGIERIAAARSVRCVAYLSAEFLIGPQLGANLLTMNLTEPMREGLASLGQNLDDIIFHEPEPGLGNGGLGRLAACYLDSLATLGVPAIGYGIRYEYGMFRQAIEDGAQVELADKWLRHGFPWELAHVDQRYEVGLSGESHLESDADGVLRARWTPARTIAACPHDIPVAGHGGKHCNLLRLWRAEAVEAFDFEAFNTGAYFNAVHDKIFSETISKVLYPNDDPYQGKQLRLGQQYFFVSASLQDMLHIHKSLGRPLDTFHETFAVQLNDTHPAIAVAELMRLLVDVHCLDWDTAWSVTTRTFAYTNHTLLPEALEKWPVPLFAGALPRHLEIIYEINRRFLDAVRAAHPEDPDLPRRVSLIDETGSRSVRMAHLASVGSQKINGVAKLHSDLLKQDVLRDFALVSPEKFTNVTNGVTPRRWLALCNPHLAACISRRIGVRWLDHFEEEIIQLEAHADDPVFQAEWRAAKQANKTRLADLARRFLHVELDPAALFDVQVKRIHEYKRQHLNVLRVIALYNRLRRNPGMEFVPRAVIFGGKAAPGYFLAKQIILLINRVAEVVNADPAVAGRLRVAFVSNFNVRSGQVIYPAADLSQQISLAGKEASGTGNMKFGINGAVTIGTLDGANVEMREAVGEENFFLFGLTTEEVQALRRTGTSPADQLAANPELAEALDQIASGLFSRGDTGLFRPLVDNLMHRDEYLVLTDFASYMDCQDRAAAAYADPAAWTRMSILNVARLGYFSSDRAIREYCSTIWNVPVE
ncbi:glycogen/starch/alpha-glucan phosphorylase [Megalodesulfovibrio paquesii]